MKLKDLPIGRFFIEDFTCEYYKKISDTESVVVTEDGKIWGDPDSTDWKQKPITCEFPPNHEIEEHIPGSEGSTAS